MPGTLLEFGLYIAAHTSSNVMSSGNCKGIGYCAVAISLRSAARGGGKNQSFNICTLLSKLEAVIVVFLSFHIADSLRRSLGDWL